MTAQFAVRCVLDEGRHVVEPWLRIAEISFKVGCFAGRCGLQIVRNSCTRAGDAVHPFTINIVEGVTVTPGLIYLAAPICPKALD